MWTIIFYPQLFDPRPNPAKKLGGRNWSSDQKSIVFVGYPDNGRRFLVLDLTTYEVRTEGVVECDEASFSGRDIDWMITRKKKPKMIKTTKATATNKKPDEAAEQDESPTNRTYA